MGGVRIIIPIVRIIIPVVGVIIVEGTSKKEMALVPEMISVPRKVLSLVFYEATAGKTMPGKPSEMATATSEMATATKAATGKMASTATKAATSQMTSTATKAAAANTDSAPTKPAPPKPTPPT